MGENTKPLTAFQRGNRLSAQGRYKEAIDQFKLHAKEFPNEAAKALANAGKCCLHVNVLTEPKEIVPGVQLLEQVDRRHDTGSRVEARRAGFDDHGRRGHQTRELGAAGAREPRIPPRSAHHRSRLRREQRAFHSCDPRVGAGCPRPERIVSSNAQITFQGGWLAIRYLLSNANYHDDLGSCHSGTVRTLSWPCPSVIFRHTIEPRTWEWTRDAPICA